jgi:Tfp pilus assembly protein PilF
MAVANSSMVVNANPYGPRRSALREALAAAGAILQAGDLPRAEMACGEIVLNHPTSGEAWFFLGVASQLQKKIDASIELYRRAVRLSPGLSEAWNNLGVSLQARGEIDEALACHREALRLEPGYPEAHNNVGNALQAMGRLDEAIESYRRALHFRPNYFEAMHHMGNALGAMGRTDEAIACYDEVIRRAPDYHKVRLCRAMAWLQAGDYERGWAEYEWRLLIKEQSIPPLTQPPWDGKPLEGKSILILAEQGLGDALQFCRYAGLAARQGGRVTVACRQPLERILGGCTGVGRVISEKDPIPEFDCYAPLLSMPRICGTSLETIPAEVPYISVDPALEARWRAELGAIEGFKIGVAWQGNPDHGKDRQRSFRLAQLEPLAKAPGVCLISLQKGLGHEQLGGLDGRFPVIDLGPRLEDLADTAAVVRNLDLVVSPDTSLAHLAGALGARVWLALPQAADWRWLTGRDDTPWYPTMRLFRQARWGDWDAVFACMAASIVGGTSRSRPSEAASG